MKLYQAYVAGKHERDRIAFFLVERRSKEMLRQILLHLDLGDIRQKIRGGHWTLKEAEALCIIASKLLTLPEVEGLQSFTQEAMGLPANRFFYEEVEPPLDKAALEDKILQLALKEYHEDGLFLALWFSPRYQLPVKIGGFVMNEAQFILQERAAQVDKHFANFVQQAETIEDLLEDNAGKSGT